MKYKTLIKVFAVVLVAGGFVMAEQALAAQQSEDILLAADQTRDQVRDRLDVDMDRVRDRDRLKDMDDADQDRDRDRDQLKDKDEPDQSRDRDRDRDSAD